MKKVIIVGAGIAGLTAGVYALQSGFDVTIYESHTIPGGASTSWRRKGYFFEGGMHWLTGSSPKTQLHKLWREVGALTDEVSIYDRDPFFTFEHQGKTVHLYRDIERLCKHFLEIAPEDREEILALVKDIRKFSKLSMPISDIKGVKVKQKTKMPITTVLGVLPVIPRMSFYASLTAGEFSERFKNPLLRLLMQNVVGTDYNATGLLFTLATFTSGDGGYPKGGSLAMAMRIAKKVETLGGRIVYGKPVTKVIVRDGAAVGVVVEGSQIFADAVIVARDTLTAIDTLFDPPIREDWTLDMRKSTVPVLDTFIGVGVEADLTDLPESLTFTLEEPLICGGVPITSLSINHYAGYEGYAPEGCTALTSFVLVDNYAYWKSCKENGTYEAEKKKLAEAFIEILAKKYPKTEGRVVVWDVATPLTYERYIGSYKGSWMTLTGKGNPSKRYPSQPESIRNVYFASHRLTPPGGLPSAAESGRRAVQHLCKDTDTLFQGTL